LHETTGVEIETREGRGQAKRDVEMPMIDRLDLYRERIAFRRAFGTAESGHAPDHRQALIAKG